jgi:hypothetical protein
MNEGGREPATEPLMSDQKKPNNIKTALILASIALMFFIGLFIKRLWLS